MKKTIFALALFTSVLCVLGCHVETDYGIEFRGVFDCSQTTYPAATSAATMRTGGSYDTLLNEYTGTTGEYWVHIGAANTLASSVNSTRGQTEGNTIKLTDVEVEWSVPKGWTSLPKVKVNFNALLLPGGSVLGMVNIMNQDVHLAIAANLAKSAYGNLQNIPIDPTLHPLYRPLAGAVCNVGTNEAVCGGYACIADDPTLANVSGSIGKCTNTCDIEQGCESECGINGTDEAACYNNCLPDSAQEIPLACTTPFIGKYVCERGPLPVCNWDGKKFVCKDGISANVTGGICRKSCSPLLNDCPGPVVDPGSGRTLYSYECINNMCLPSVAYSCKGSACSAVPASGVPAKPVELTAAITVHGRDANGHVVSSFTQHYKLNVCRDCMVKYDNASCKTANVGDYKDFIDSLTKNCETPTPYQDNQLECAWINGCASKFCSR